MLYFMFGIIRNEYKTMCLCRTVIAQQGSPGNTMNLDGRCIENIIRSTLPEQTSGPSSSEYHFKLWPTSTVGLTNKTQRLMPSDGAS